MTGPPRRFRFFRVPDNIDEAMLPGFHHYLHRPTWRRRAFAHAPAFLNKSLSAACKFCIAAWQHNIFCDAPIATIYLPQQGIVLLAKSKGAIMFLSHIVRALRSWRRYNRSVRELSRLGDRELADIGIARSDITQVAWLSAQD
jgi:uncharacterized protein YjiS (DUF1127 family)